MSSVLGRIGTHQRSVLFAILGLLLAPTLAGAQGLREIPARIQSVHIQKEGFFGDTYRADLTLSGLGVVAPNILPLFRP